MTAANLIIMIIKKTTMIMTMTTMTRITRMNKNNYQRIIHTIRAKYQMPRIKNQESNTKYQRPTINKLQTTHSSSILLYKRQGALKLEGGRHCHRHCHRHHSIITHGGWRGKKGWRKCSLSTKEFVLKTLTKSLTISAMLSSADRWLAEVANFPILLIWRRG